MGVEPLFDHRKYKLLVDPVTKRVVYVARNGIMPERVLIVSGGRQHAFGPAWCEVVECATGSLPQGITAQNCWGYRSGPRGLEPVDLGPPVAVEKTG